MNYRFNINGIDIEAQFSDKAINEIFLPMLKYLSNLQKQLGRRILVMLAAPPGAGKSTLLAFLEGYSKNNGDTDSIQVIGMDGFHRRQEYLESHTTERDKKIIPLVRIKGAPITFDLDALKQKVREVADGKTCGWPIYDRKLHNPVDDAVTVDKDIVLLEGNYLLLDQEGWRDLCGYADFTIFLRGDEEQLRSRLIERKMLTGVDRNKAVAFVDYSDMVNVRLCLEHSLKADLELGIDKDNDFYIISDRRNILG